MDSMTFGATPLRAMDSRNLTVARAIFSSERWKLRALRRFSASSPLKSAMTMAISSICS